METPCLIADAEMNRAIILALSYKGAHITPDTWTTDSLEADFPFVVR